MLLARRAIHFALLFPCCSHSFPPNFSPMLLNIAILEVVPMLYHVMLPDKLGLASLLVRVKAKNNVLLGSPFPDYAARVHLRGGGALWIWALWKKMASPEYMVPLSR